jgi:hypothetical protein
MLPDVDGDGFGERLLGHSIAGGGFTGEGAIYYDLLTRGGAIKERKATHSDASGGMRNRLNNLATFGASCSCVQSSVPDLDLDADLSTFECFIGSPGDTAGVGGDPFDNFNYGAVWSVRLRKSDGAMMGQPTRFNMQTAALASLGWENNVDFGAAVAVVGGTASSLLVAVGRSGTDVRTSSSDNGEILILRLGSGGLAISGVTRINYQNPSMPASLRSLLSPDNVRLGSALATSGDFDGDGNADVAFGASKVDSNSRSNMGMAGVLFLDATGGIRGGVGIDFVTQVPSLSATAGASSGLGESIVVLGDLFGTGGSVLLAGAPLATDSGAAVILSMDAGRSAPLTASQMLTQTSSALFESTIGESWWMGTSAAAGIGDFDTGWEPLIPGSVAANATNPTNLVITLGLAATTGKLITIEAATNMPGLVAASSSNGEVPLSGQQDQGSASSARVCCFDAKEPQTRLLAMRLDAAAIAIDTDSPPRVVLIVPPATPAVAADSGETVGGINRQSQPSLWESGALVGVAGATAECKQAAWRQWSDTRTSANLTCVPPAGVGQGFRVAVSWAVRRAPAALPAALATRTTELDPAIVRTWPTSMLHLRRR